MLRVAVIWAALVAMPAAQTPTAPPTARQNTPQQDRSGEATRAEPLRIAVKPAPPFAMETADGQGWEGLAVELWQRIAEENGYPFTVQPVATVEDAFDGVSQGRFDAAIGALTVTAERQERVDFSHPFHTSGLAIAVNREASEVTSLLHGLFSADFLRVIGVLCLLILVFGVLVWLAERRRNPEQFGGRTIQGIGEGFWWSAVTMTTVGYGDRAPTTRTGRGIALVWMFASVVTISGFTAAIASSVTADRITGRIRGPEDLHGIGPVGTVSGSSSAAWLQGKGLPRQNAPDVDAMLAAVRDGKVAAAVFDAPLLRWKLLQEAADWGDMRLLPATFAPQDYAIALPRRSGLRGDINVALLEITRTASWEDLLRENLGQE